MLYSIVENEMLIKEANMGIDRANMGIDRTCEQLWEIFNIFMLYCIVENIMFSFALDSGWFVYLIIE